MSAVLIFLIFVVAVVSLVAWVMQRDDTSVLKTLIELRSVLKTLIELRNELDRLSHRNAKDAGDRIIHPFGRRGARLGKMTPAERHFYEEHILNPPTTAEWLAQQRRRDPEGWRHKFWNGKRWKPRLRPFIDPATAPLHSVTSGGYWWRNLDTLEKRALQKGGLTKPLMEAVLSA